MLNQFNLDGKTALITGAAGLLGIEHAAALLECGARVILSDINDKALDAAHLMLRSEFDAQKIVIKCLNVSDEGSVIRVCDDLKNQGIQVDILVNNAAIDPKVKSNASISEASRLENFSLEEWNFEISVGLTGAFLCSKVFGREMALRNEGGVILNIASDLSVISPDQRLYRKEGVSDDNQPVKPVTYSVIKSGLIGLTRYLATYWARQGIRCNALSPGGVFNNQDQNFVKNLCELIPIGRMAKKDEYRSAIQFLCSDASKYMNGQNIVIDGGRSVL